MHPARKIGRRNYEGFGGLMVELFQNAHSKPCPVEWSAMRAMCVLVTAPTNTTAPQLHRKPPKTALPPTFGTGCYFIREAEIWCTTGKDHRCVLCARMLFFFPHIPCFFPFWPALLCRAKIHPGHPPVQTMKPAWILRVHRGLSTVQ